METFSALKTKPRYFQVLRGRGAGWMITYGDMVTLLLTFFVLVLVILNEAENNIYRIINLMLNETKNDLSAYVHQNVRDKSITVERSTKGVKLTISSASLFDINDAEIKPEIKPVLSRIASILRQSRLFSPESDPVLKTFVTVVENSGHLFQPEIRVEGHTDNWVIRGGRYASNWELSSARALNVVNFLSRTSGLPESYFSALGYGEYRPIADNNTPEGRAKNRRVEIFIDANIVKANNSLSVQ